MMIQNLGALAVAERGQPEAHGADTTSPVAVQTTGAEVERLDIFTVAEAAAFLRLNMKTLYKLIDEGRVPHVRIGERRIRLRRSSLVAWLASQESGSRDRRNR